MDRLNQTAPRGRPVSSVDAAKACEVLEHLVSAGTLKAILGNYRLMCELLHLKPNVFPLFYPRLRANLNSWKAKALWKKFDVRANHKCYARGKACPNTRVLIIGAGPCGLRTAIEAQLLGAKVVLIEKRDRMSRNNVLHLWPFVIEDLRALAAKKFFGKFCAGAIDHISIRQLQCILLKVALLLGVEVHTEVSFEKLVEPSGAEKIGWRAEFKPSDHPVSQYEFDVIIGADGKRNTLQGFKRKEFRGKLAIAITANFINKRTEAEARVEEISGVAFIFNQKFFKELNAETGIDLENIVYYKDDTHYFVMTAKKPSLIEKGVIKTDYVDTARLLSPDNVDREALLNYAREAADFSTNYQMPDLEFAVNHYGQPDVAMFDFTSMYAAENASKVIERHGYKLLMTLVGDSLLEPFWPTGSGCARGFLSSLDACWAIKAWGSGLTTPLEVLAERESIYRLLAQTTPENLNKDWKAYTLDPSSRYPNLNKAVLLPQQVLSLYDSDDPSGIELTSRAPPPVNAEPHRKRRRRDTHLDPNTLISWIKEQIREHEDLTVEDLTTSFKDGRVLCAVLHHYRPDLLDYSAIRAEDVAKNNQLAFDLLEKEIGISPVMTGEDMANAEVPDYLTMFSYLTQIYDAFRGEIPHIKHPKLTSPPQEIMHPKTFFVPNYKTKSSNRLSEPNQFKSKRRKPEWKNIFKDELKYSKSALGVYKSLEAPAPLKRTTYFSMQTNILSYKPMPTSTEVSTNTDANFIQGKQVTDQKVEQKPDLGWKIGESVTNEEKKCCVQNNNLQNGKNFRDASVNCEQENSSKTSSDSTLLISSSLLNLEGNEHEKPNSTSDEYSGSSSDYSPSSEDITFDVFVRSVEKNDKSVSVQKFQFCPCLNTFFIDKLQRCSDLKYKMRPKGRKRDIKGCHAKTEARTPKCSCQNLDTDLDGRKFLYTPIMNTDKSVPAELTYDRIVDWINLSNFKDRDNASDDVTDVVDKLTDISSITRIINEHCKTDERGENVEALEGRTPSLDSISKLMEKLKYGVTGFPKTWKRPLSKLTISERPNKFTSIRETEEADLPEPKEPQPTRPLELTASVISRYTTSARPKRHAEPVSQSKPATASERKPKKRRSFEKYELGVKFKELLPSVWESLKVAVVLLLLDFIINTQDYIA